MTTGEPYERDIVSDLDDKTDDRATANRRLPLHLRILLGLIVGAGLGGTSRLVFGADAPWLAWTTTQLTEPVGQLFLRLLLMTAVPLAFSSLVVGTAGIGNLKRLGRVGAKTLGFTLVLSMISVLIGLSLANLIKPGAKIDQSVRDQLLARYGAYPVAWILGGEASDGQGPLSDLAKYLYETDPYRRLLVYHSPSDPRKAIKANNELFDFDMVGIGHDGMKTARETLALIQSSLGQTPTRPALCGEACYEGHMQTNFQDKIGRAHV